MFLSNEAKSCRLFILSSLLLLLGVQSVFALPEDRQAIMKLRANKADLNQGAHRGVYVGEVQLDQGSTHIRAHRAITLGDQKNRLTEAIAEGNKENQAHYWSLPSHDKPMLHAYADKMYYYPHKNLIKLVGNAYVEQGKHSFTAPIITYDTLHQHVTTEGKSRTKIIIHPEKKP